MGDTGVDHAIGIVGRTIAEAGATDEGTLGQAIPGTAAMPADTPAADFMVANIAAAVASATVATGKGI